MSKEIAATRDTAYIATNDVIFYASAKATTDATFVFDRDSVTDAAFPSGRLPHPDNSTATAEATGDYARAAHREYCDV